MPCLCPCCVSDHDGQPHFLAINGEFFYYDSTFPHVVVGGHRGRRFYTLALTTNRFLPEMDLDDLEQLLDTGFKMPAVCSSPTAPTPIVERMADAQLCEEFCAVERRSAARERERSSKRDTRRV